MPLMPAHGRQRQAALSKMQFSLVYKTSFMTVRLQKEKLYLDKQKQTKENKVKQETQRNKNLR